MTLISHSWSLLATAVYNSSLRPLRKDTVATDIPCYKERFGKTACYLLLFLGCGRVFCSHSTGLWTWYDFVYWWAGLSLSVHCVAAKKPDRERQLIL